MAEQKVQYIIELKDQFSKKADQVSKSVDSLTSTTKSTVAGFKALGAAFIGSQIVQGFAGMIDQANESAKVTAQLEAVLSSTGNAVGMTANELTTLADSISSLSVYEDEAVLSAENVLLTFTQIGSTTFPAATQAVADLSAAMGQDLQSSAVQIGKALNAPIEGITALTRVGVSFTEEQKDVIAALVETGDVAGAQTIILEELAKEFGGSAEAQLTPIDKLKKGVGDLGEKIGTAFLPAVNEAINGLFSFGGTASQFFDKLIMGLGDFVLGMVQSVEVVVQLGKGLVIELGLILNGIVRTIQLAAIKVINSIIGWIEDKINTMGKVVRKLGMDDMADKLTVNFKRIEESATGFGAIWSEVGNWTTQNVSMIGGSISDIIFKHEELGKASTASGASMQQFGEGAKGASKEAEQSFQKLYDAAADSFGKIDDALEQTESNIKDIQASMDSLFTSRAEDQQSEQEKLAEAFVKQYERIEELKRDIAEETDSTERNALKEQLALAEEELAKHANAEQLIAAEISNAKDYARKSDFEKAFADFQEQNMLIEQKFQLEYQKLQEKLVNEQTAQKTLLDLKAKGEQLAAQITLNAEKLTIESVNRQIAAYNALADAVTGAKSGKKTASASTTGTSEALKNVAKTLSIPAFASGGIVTGPTLAMVGEAGPEAIIPLSSKGGGAGSVTNNISINWSGAVDERAAETVAKEIVKQLNLNLNYSLL